MNMTSGLGLWTPIERIDAYRPAFNDPHHRDGLLPWSMGARWGDVWKPTNNALMIDVGCDVTSSGGSPYTHHSANSNESSAIDSWTDGYTPGSSSLEPGYDDAMDSPLSPLPLPPILPAPFGEEDRTSLVPVEFSERMKSLVRALRAPVQRPLRPLSELSTTRSSASRGLRAQITTEEVIRPNMKNSSAEIEELFNSFVEDMCQPMPAFHFVDPQTSATGVVG